ncbi:hypothetical protein POM88_031572 [Heracleum sosnowskyi]|uniref:Uncharacterized protein n=1 Tax=Heracleum sosnowskyi TaxID=360622 RepID=A0AAD8MJX4_9APIA|nr:hypothetical protein POM88_031572 [Heracleum sosnowskyi]
MSRSVGVSESNKQLTLQSIPLSELSCIDNPCNYYSGEPNQPVAMIELAGELNVRDIEDNCRINKVACVSVPYWDYVFSNMSEIYDALVYGFELPWSYFYCLNCQDNGTDCIYTSNPDHRLWDCQARDASINAEPPPCNFNRRPYHLSISCLLLNLNGIRYQFRYNYIKIGIVAALILAARFLLEKKQKKKLLP